MKKPFQYSIRRLFLTTTVVATAAWVLTATPSTTVFVGLAILAMLIPSLLLVGVLRGRTYVRTFCAGALFPICATPFHLTSVIDIVRYHWSDMYGVGGLGGLPDDGVVRHHFGIIWICCFATGLLSVLVDCLLFQEQREPKE